MAHAIRVDHRIETQPLDVSEAEGREALMLHGYFAGFLDSSLFWQRDSSAPFKIPLTITVDQLQAVVEKYLTNHPEQLHEHGAWLVFRALGDSFPNPDYRKPN